MTDPEFADRTCIEPLTPAVVAQIIAREKPDALLPTLGGQTALNLAVALAENGVLAQHGVQLIGAQLDAIKKAEDRLLFKQAMERIGEAEQVGARESLIVLRRAQDERERRRLLVALPRFCLGTLKALCTRRRAGREPAPAF